MPAVVEAGHESDRNPDDQRSADRDQADHDGDAGSEEDPAEHVAAHAIGPEEEVGPRGQETLGRVELPHVLGIGGEPRREDGAEHEPRDEDEPEGGGAVLAQPAKEEGHLAQPFATAGGRTGPSGREDEEEGGPRVGKEGANRCIRLIPSDR